MIRSLRARQRVLISGVGLVVGVAGVAGIAVRRSVPAVVLPATLEPSQPAARAAVTPAMLRFGSARIRGELAVLEDGGAVATIEVGDGGETGPLAAYWSPDGPVGTLSPDAVWLGSIAPRKPNRLKLPRLPTERRGKLVLFDHGDGRVIAAADLAAEVVRP